MNYCRALVACAVLALALGSPQPARADNPLQDPTCNLTVRFTAGTTVVLVQHDGQHAIRVCSYNVSMSLVTTSTAQLVWGTTSSTACDTSKVSMSAQLSIGSAVTAANYAMSAGDGWGFLDENPSRGVSDLCLLTTGAATASGIIRYALY